MSCLAQQTFTFSTIKADVVAPVLTNILTAAYQQLGIEITVKQMSGDRSLLEANTGHVSGEAGRSKYIQVHNPNLIKIPVPVYFMQTAVFTKLDIPIPTSPDHLLNYDIGILRGSKDIELLFNGLEIHRLTTTEQLIKMVYANRIQVAIAPKEESLEIIYMFGLKGIKTYDFPVPQQELYHYLHKKHADLAPRITEVLQKMAKQGEIQRITTQTIQHILNPKPKS